MHLSVFLVAVQRGARARTLELLDVVGCVQAVQGGAPWATVEGGAVPPSYPAQATATVCLAVRRRDGDVTVGLRRVPAARVLGSPGKSTGRPLGRIWTLLDPWEGRDFADRLEQWAIDEAPDRVRVRMTRT